jgi:hypothetical protein
VERVEHLELHKLGLRKGSCPVTEENIARGVQAARQQLAAGEPDASSTPG